MLGLSSEPCRLEERAGPTSSCWRWAGSFATPDAAAAGRSIRAEVQLLGSAGRASDELEVLCERISRSPVEGVAGLAVRFEAILAELLVDDGRWTSAHGAGCAASAERT